jgi:winged helix-turn helix protein
MKLRLKRATRLWLRRVDRKTRDAELRVRCRVLLKVAAGRTCNAAAHEVGCVPSTAVRIVARFEAYGEAALRDGRSENGRPKVDDDVRAGICRILERSPPDFGYPRPTLNLRRARRPPVLAMRDIVSAFRMMSTKPGAVSCGHRNSTGERF